MVPPECSCCAQKNPKPIAQITFQRVIAIQIIETSPMCTRKPESGLWARDYLWPGRFLEILNIVTKLFALYTTLEIARPYIFAIYKWKRKFNKDDKA